MKNPFVENVSELLGYNNIVDSFLTYDFSVKKNFRLKNNNLSIGLAIINLFDEKAPKLYNAPDFSFDTRVHDPRGRLFKLSFKISH